MSSSRRLLVVTFVFMLCLILGDGLEKSNSTEISKIMKESRLVGQLSPESPTHTAPDNPCNFKALKKPNFDVPGQRLSESKCQQYLWEVESSKYNSKKNRECECSIKSLNVNVSLPIIILTTNMLRRVGSAWLEQQNKNSNTGDEFVTGGKDAKPGDFPHMGAVGWKLQKGTWIFLCGSALISTKYLLTAAHCSKVSSRYPDIASTIPDIVRLGANNINDADIDSITTINAQIERVIVPPQYVTPKRYFDIAIIKLWHDVTINEYIQPACLWTKPNTISLGNNALVTGWGVTDQKTLTTSTVLQVAEVDILDSNVCDELLKPLCNRLWCGMSDSQLCAGKLAGHVDTCQGDSGGPLQVKMDFPSNSQVVHGYYLVGVTSFGFGCGQANTPGLYTRISSFIDWIEDAVWSDRS